jgi:hypothetical protein
MVRVGRGPPKARAFYFENVRKGRAVPYVPIGNEPCLENEKSFTAKRHFAVDFYEFPDKIDFAQTRAGLTP